MNNLFLVACNGRSPLLSNLFNTFREAFSNFKFVDAVDIILLSLILFWAFRFVKGRKAGALLIGIITISTLTFLAYIFDLNATFYLFSEIFSIGIIALVIIFQPEIRDGLEKLGSGSMSGFMAFGDQKKKKQLYIKSIENICNAINDLSSSKTGALIVISRTTKLDDVIETGVVINADVNSFLIRNIFYNKAPLHDGAIVIDDGKICAAGCLLPLTRRSDIDSDLGTRHRAALGMSETSDAIVVVVSEETGTISVSIDCEITRDFTAESLRNFLTKKLVGISENI